MAHQITFVPSGHTCEAGEDESILQAAMDAGLLLPYGCRNGACGACKGKIASGRVDHDGASPSALTEAEKAAGLALFCCARPLGDITVECREIDVGAAIPVRTMPCRVQKMQLLAPDVMLLRLKLPSGERLQFLPGQYVEILLSGGRRRAFSLANAPEDDEELELHVRLIPGGAFTSHVFNGMKERDILRFEGPLGGFGWNDLSDATTPAVLVAGGTGFAPVKSMVEQLLRHEIKRPLYLYWGARDHGGLYLDDLASGWARDHAHIHYVPVLSDISAVDEWPGRRGIARDANEVERVEVYRIAKGA